MALHGVFRRGLRLSHLILCDCIIGRVGLPLIRFFAGRRQKMVCLFRVDRKMDMGGFAAGVKEGPWFTGTSYVTQLLRYIVGPTLGVL